MRRRGFTIIELVITITIMAILLTLGVVSLSGTQKNARDSERKSDISTIALNLESYYLSGTDSSTISQDCTGGIISHDGIYTVHKYISSGAITCNGSVSSEVLIVAGGGGGGYSGGGGGGGVISASVDIAGGTSYLVNVGAGGTAGSLTVQGGNGGNSSFASLISVGGGGGGKAASVGSAGGSGGGGGTNSAVGNTWAGGAGVEGQGYAGGTTTGLSCSPSGGGGGAGGIGSNSTSTSGGAGGIGIVSSISGTLTYYGGGGGGGAYCLSGGSGGIGGGGAGSNWDVGTSGTANTGGGGGGGATGGSGGSGIVIISYLTGSITATGGTITTSGNYTIHTFTSSGSFIVSSSNIYKLAVLGGSPVGYWRLNEISGSVATDISGVGRNGIYTAGTTLNQLGPISAIDSKAVLFNGTTGKITTDDNTILSRTNGQALSVEAWIKPNWTSGYRDIVANRCASSLNWLLYQHRTDGSLQLHGSSQNKSGYIPPNGVWTYVVATVDSAGVYKLYANGVLVQTLSGYTYGSACSTLNIGAGPSNVGEYYNGVISEVAVYNRALSVAEINQHYAARSSL